MKRFLQLFFFILVTQTFGQNEKFNIDDYSAFLKQNLGMSYSDVVSLHDAGKFKATASNIWDGALYHDSIEIKLNLSETEIEMIRQNGFVVRERNHKTFGDCFHNIYHSDLPVFISTDAISHAFHYSYDGLLKTTEMEFLSPKLIEMLNGMKNGLGTLQSNYSGNEIVLNSVNDVDVYLTVALKLLDESVSVTYSENQKAVNDILSLIEKEQAGTYKLFSSVERKIDFSQFKPRSHYTENQTLKNYFKAMIWLGKTELYLVAPKEDDETPKLKDIQRQIIDAVLISELIDLTNQNNNYNDIESVIKAFVGDQDNVTLTNLRGILEEESITDASEFADTNNIAPFQETLKTKSWAFQKIISQLLMRDPMNPEKVEPAVAFLLFGQRFVIDSYVTGSVVYDRIDSRRMLPSTMDILFSLGNDAALQFLKEDLETHNYNTELSALRYLIDNYDDDFWKSSVYSNWVQSIRTLNPPEDRSVLPSFMQTGLWWQHKMNSQLSSWAELRHDNVLYAKQSYTTMVSCSYPFGYVEPVPKFYETMSQLAENMNNAINSVNGMDADFKSLVNDFYEHFAAVNDTLSSIAQKELDGVVLTDNEISFMKRVLQNKVQVMCGENPYDGWYTRLYFDQEWVWEADKIVVDYHTSPTDASGSPIGWVAHAGTGAVDEAVFAVTLQDGKTVAFAGPVATYYEYTTTNFLRLTDEEWADEGYFEKALRPEWTKSYMTDLDGNKKGKGINLITNINEPINNTVIPRNYITAKNYPNPFNPATVISFIVPNNLSNNNVTLRIYNINGELVKELLNKNLSSGNYLTKWNGNDLNGRSVASGIYFYEIRIKEHNFIGKMNLMK